MKTIFSSLLLILALDVKGAVSLLISTTSPNSLTITGAMTAGSVVSPTINTIYRFFGTNAPMPFQPTNTIFVIDGQSLATGIAPILTNMGWFSGMADVYVVAVGATGLIDATNRWASNKLTLSSRLKGGTNGIYMFWGMQGDVNLDPATEITRLTNWVQELISSNWNVVLFTIEPIGTDYSRESMFLPIVNNFIRSWHKPWRVVDVEPLIPNPWDFRLYMEDSFDHLHPDGYTNIAIETAFTLLSPYRRFHPQSYVNTMGTNIMVTAPGHQGYRQSFVGAFGQSGIELGTNSPWPSAPICPGSAKLVNSNGTVYLLTSGPDGTAWIATNKLAP